MKRARLSALMAILEQRRLYVNVFFFIVAVVFLWARNRNGFPLSPETYVADVFADTLISSTHKLEHKLSCDRLKFVGPYLVLPGIGGGLFNQYMSLYSNLYSASGWASTGGTAVLANIAMTRTNWSSPPIWHTISLSELFDLHYLIKHMKGTFNLSICIGPLNMTSRHVHNLRLRSSGLDPGYTPSNILEEASTKSKFTGSSVFLASGNFGGAFVPFNVTDPNSEPLQTVRNAATAIQMNRTIKRMANKVLSCVRKSAGDLDSVIGIHLRLEGDWDTLPQHIDYRLLQYKQAINNIMSKQQQKSFFLYIASGDLVASSPGDLRGHSSNASAKVRSWLADVVQLPYIDKTKCLGSHSLNMLYIEQQAAVDALVLTALGDFVGCAPSSFSYCVWEFRNARNLDGLMIRKPGFPIFFPIFQPPRSDWRSVKDPEPNFDWLSIAPQDLSGAFLPHAPRPGTK